MELAEGIKAQPKRQPSLNFALMTIVVLILFIVASMSLLGIPIVTTLFFSWLILVPFAWKLGYSPKEIEKDVYEMIKVGAGLFALLLAIGCMIAVWISAGTVPTLIYWGLELISPKYFLVVAFLISMLISLPLGTNWGTVSTVGVAMMGIGMGMGISPGIVAGAVVSGSCVGNLVSPVADTPLLTSTIAGVPLMKHLKHMVSVAVPGVIISAALYTVVGFYFSDASMDVQATNNMLSSLAGTFNIGWITLIPLAVVIGLLACKQSAVAAIMVGCFVGSFISVFYQGHSFSEVGNFLATGVSIETGNKFLDPILNRGGISSMLELIGVVVAALGMGGILKGSGILGKIIDSMSHVIHSRVGLITSTFAGCAVCSSLVAANYFSMIMNATLMAPLYKKFRYRPENASRAVSNFTDCLSMMVPWSLNGTFIAATLGVPLIAIIPFMFFNITMIVLELVYGLCGISLTKYSDEEFEEVNDQQGSGLKEISHS
ncbi:TPA: hypothetical protein L9L52_005247 [Klebsiella quasipneumoniae subsp. quasipneumoniae]|nr:hypothetical protein [Klebsiella quasipneumoniae subsp. similipneumoniae]HBR1462332.1 hypothetical protein [Klebsiella quasipneumoniae subsp. quasipneumoniae]HBR1984991.1 hypothetical protein [Klebsiella quasipneumoniae subsp. quasipneumoniae]HBR2038376.1 hypothetical protein [Klebsiella quasipneumoniae subsp. quasipneumoniae]HCI6432719.1 hypothetical protein [Klebsiella quasipneumoniae subsp. similipneumoniae]